MDVEWVEREPGRLDEEVRLDCPEGYRNKDDLTLDTTLVRCTLDGWVNVDSCVQGEPEELARTDE